MEEFTAAVADASASTLDAPSVVSVREQYDQEGELLSRTWTDFRPEEGASVHFQPAEGEDAPPPQVQAGVETEDFFALADSEFDGWIVNDREPDSVTSPRRIQLWLDDAPDLPDDGSLDDISVTRQDMSDGGEVWAVSLLADSEIQSSQRWSIHPDGHVRGYRTQLVQVDELGGVPAPEEMPVLIDATIQLVDEPSPLPQPDEGQPLDLTVFSLPDNFLSEESLADSGS